MSEKLKESNDRLIRDKLVFDRNKVKIESELEVMRQNCADLRLRLDATEERKTGVRVQLRAKEDLIKKYADIIGRAEELTQQTVDDLLSESRTAHNSGLYIFANEMTEEVMDFCVEQTTEAIKKYSDIKSMADYIVYAMDERFGNSWYCFIGQDFAHNSLLHVFGTYFSFAINDHKIIIYKTNDVVSYDLMAVSLTQIH